jgi:NADPH:quinone reductase-like Zn-dependent oxidoreductase
MTGRLDFLRRLVIFTSTTAAEKHMRAARLNAYGDPSQVVEFVEVPDPPAPGPDQVLVAVDLAPINPADLLLAMGYYVVRPPLPSPLGNEGVGTVRAVGSAVREVAVGDRVALPLSSFTWREKLVVSAKGLAPLPKQAPLEQLAMIGVNPVTASLLLSEFVDLHKGDWLLQNAANSGVGRSVIALARHAGLRTINIVRRQELMRELHDAGADVVLVDGPDAVARAQRAAAGAPIRLALDGLSGPASGVLASILSPDGTLVTYGAMTGAAIQLGPADVIFKNLTLKSFFVGDSRYAAKVPAARDQAASLIASGKLNVPVAAVYPLRELKSAIDHAKHGGKVLLRMTRD